MEICITVRTLCNLRKGLFVKKISCVQYNKEDPEHYAAFSQLFSDYLDEIFSDNPDDNLPKHVLPRIINTIVEETQKYKEWLYLCAEVSTYIGFAMFQIDTPDNPMCKRNGWGFIREFYIVPSQRKKGHAKSLCNFIEEIMAENNGSDIYLTADKTSESFWEAVGYTFSGAYDDVNGNKIYEKRRIA